MRVDRASRHLRAERERAFHAFVDPEEFVSWIAPEGMTGALERFDPLRGYRLRLTYDRPPREGGKTTSDSDIAVVRRVRVDPPHRIVEEVDFDSDDPAFAGTMRMTWTIEAEPGGCRVTLEATDVPSGIAQDVHVGAFVASLGQLAELVETVAD